MFEPLFGPIWQWGFLVKNLDDAMQSWVKQCGVGPWWIYRDVKLQSLYNGVAAEVQMHVGLAYQNGVQIELIQQVNDVESPYRFFYKRDGAQLLQQLGYLVDDMDAAIAAGKKAGLREIGSVSNGYSRYTYMSSDSLGDLVVELMPRIPEAVAAFKDCARVAEKWDGKEPFRTLSLT